MRIGEILIERGWVTPASLARAIAEQRHTGKRLCSLLIARGLLDPDHAARALGEQHDVAAALQRHLVHRERELAALLPAALGRSRVALPIGRMRGGELVVCVRDPSPELAAALARALSGPIVIAVAPALSLEPLIAEAYTDAADADAGSVDVDLTTQTIAVIPDAIGLGALELVELDDAGVTRDPSQSGSFLQTGLSVTTSPPLRSPAPARSTPQAIPILVAPIPLADAIAALDQAGSPAEATYAAMRFAAGRWRTAVLFAIRDGNAVGERGHGAQIAGGVDTVTIPLAAPSIVQLAYTTGGLATELPGGPVQDRLARVLGQPRLPAAAPVRVGSHIGHILVAGDPIDGDAAHAFDLDRVADALGEAYTRLGG